MKWTQIYKAKSTLVLILSLALQALPAKALNVLGMDHLEGGADVVETFGALKPDYPLTQAWTPTGAELGPVSYECHPRTFEARYLQGAPTEQERFTRLQAYMKECGEELSRHQPGGAEALLHIMRVRYKVSDHPHIERVQFRLSNGETTRGILALKPEKDPLPLIVVKCGLFCDGDSDGMARAALMHLYDESPFHVLLLGNHTGVKNVKRNRRVVVGGFYEGIETLEIGRWLKLKSDLRHKIGSLHLLGISLGAHAALYTSFYNDFNPINDDHKVYQSVIAYCTPVDLKATVESLYAPGPRGEVARGVTWGNMQRVYDRVPDLQTRFDRGAPAPKVNLFAPLLADLSTAYLKRQQARDTYLVPFRQEQLHTRSQYWQFNNFLDYSDGLETPTLVWSSKDDWVVSNSVNTKKLQEKHENSRKKGQLMILNSDKGNHCASALTYGWPTVSTIFRAFFLSNSYDFWIKRDQEKHRVFIPQPFLAIRDQHISQEWKALPGQRSFRLSYKVWDGHKDLCHRTNPFNSIPACYRTESFTVGYDELQLTDINTPENDVQAQALTRWANSHLELQSRRGSLIGRRGFVTHLIRQLN